MAVNEDHRQLEIAAEIEELTRTLAHSTRDVPHPCDSYRMLGELGAIIDHIAQVCAQLGSWHARVENHKHFEGEESGTIGSARKAADELTTAANALKLASRHTHHAHVLNSVVRWYRNPQQTEED